MRCVPLFRNMQLSLRDRDELINLQHAIGVGEGIRDRLRQLVRHEQLVNKGLNLILELEKQKGPKLFEISQRLVDLINLYDHAEDMLLNWTMLKDAIQNDDRVNMEIFLMELDPAFSGKSKRYSSIRPQ